MACRHLLGGEFFQRGETGIFTQTRPVAADVIHAAEKVVGFLRIGEVSGL